MEQRKPANLARAFYTALAAGDRDQLDAVLHPEFTGRTAEGMPFGIGGDHIGPAAMRRNAWGLIARHFEARAEPDRFLDLADGRLLVTGRYRGRGKQGSATLDASTRAAPFRSAAALPVGATSNASSNENRPYANARASRAG